LDKVISKIPRIKAMRNAHRLFLTNNTKRSGRLFINPYFLPFNFSEPEIATAAYGIIALG